MGGCPADGDVEAAVRDAGRLDVRGLDPRVDVQPRGLGGPGGQVRWQPVDIAEPDGFGARDPRGPVPQVACPLEEIAGVRQQGRADGGEGDRAAVAVEQPHAEVPLQDLDLLGQ